MALIQLKGIRYSFGGHALLDGVDLLIDRGERVAMLGVNGSGKSTLLKILSGELVPDAGELAIEPGLRIASLPQEVPRNITGTIRQTVIRIVQTSRGVSVDEPLTDEDEQAVRETLSRMALSPEDPVDTLSGGARRRVWLAGALAARPDLLILDEPTNHLDVEAVLWMEQFIQRAIKTVVFVTHDRAFLERMGTRFLDLDRGKITSWPGNWALYQEKKAAALAVERVQVDKFDRLLEQEETWLRRGVKARRTRNEGRVFRLMELRKERAAMRSQIGTVQLRIEQARKSGRLVIEAIGLRFAFPGRPIVTDFSTVIARGDRIGIVGPNGCGKTTLLSLLLGKLDPQEGRVRTGVNLEIQFFGQLREELDPERTLRDMVADGREFLDIGGVQRHVIGYLRDFLFTPDQMDTPVGVLSGGERNRLLLARLFARPSNVLIMDEPTNDLDMDTLELLEDLLSEYPGTVLIVSHDRRFLDNVVTSCWRFAGEGLVEEFVGGWSDLPPPPVKAEPRKEPREKTRESAPPREKTRKRTFAETRELAGIEARIAALEAEKDTIIATLSDPDFYREHAADAARLSDRMHALDAEIEAAYERWSYLDALPEK
ncbi:ATP-binding cassette domain-containing protein [Myxococcota bacterium]|nr:ATP-binding cassette domain-containing protein [Myxococcota bacterium]